MSQIRSCLFTSCYSLLLVRYIRALDLQWNCLSLPFGFRDSLGSYCCILLLTLAWVSFTFSIVHLLGAYPEGSGVAVWAFIEATAVSRGLTTLAPSGSSSSSSPTAELPTCLWSSGQPEFSQVSYWLVWMLSFFCLMKYLLTVLVNCWVRM